MVMIEKAACGAVILNLEGLPVYERGGGAKTVPLVGKAVGNPGFITGYTSFAGGAQIPFHSHNCAESVVLIEGAAVFDIGGEHYHLHAQDATYVPPNIPHRFRNASDVNPMKILWIYERADATRTLVETGVTRPVTAEHAAH
jgi:quercetin dioxygenase-like cupin family protein